MFRSGSSWNSEGSNKRPSAQVARSSDGAVANSVWLYYVVSWPDTNLSRCVAHNAMFSDVPTLSDDEECFETLAAFLPQDMRRVVPSVLDLAYNAILNLRHGWGICGA